MLSSSLLTLPGATVDVVMQSHLVHWSTYAPATFSPLEHALKALLQLFKMVFASV